MNVCCAFCEYRHPMSVYCDMNDYIIDNICKTWCAQYKYVGDTKRNLIILKEHLDTYNEVMNQFDGDDS